MGCCVSESEATMKEPLLKDISIKTINDEIPQPAHREIIQPTKEYMDIINKTKDEYIPSNYEERNYDENDIDEKEKKRIKEIRVTRKVFEIPKVSKGTNTSDIDMNFLNNVFITNANKIENEFNEINVKCDNLIVKVNN